MNRDNLLKECSLILGESPENLLGKILEHFACIFFESKDGPTTDLESLQLSPKCVENDIAIAWAQGLHEQDDEFRDNILDMYRLQPFKLKTAVIDTVNGTWESLSPDMLASLIGSKYKINVRLGGRHVFKYESDFCIKI